jgi:predicted nuclease of predicted toxin-antitoxin system
VKFKLDENLPASSSAVLTSAGHDVDTVSAEHLIGAPDRDVVTAATTAGRILISLDVGMADIRAYPPGSHAGIIVLRLADQSARHRHPGHQRPGQPRRSRQSDGSGRGPAAQAAAHPPTLTYPRGQSSGRANSPANLREHCC